MTNGRTRDAAGHIDIVSCGTGFPSDTGVLTLLEEADAVYGSRSLMALCPVPVKNARIIGSGARKDAEEVLALGREGKRIVVLASGDALYHGFGGTLAALRTPGDNLAYHPGITAFQALFCRLGLPWQDARLFCVHSGEGLPSRGIAEAPLSVTYAGSRYPAHAIARAVLGAHPASARTTNASCPGLWASWPTPLAARRPSSSSFRPPMPIAMLRTRPPQRGAAPPFRPRYWHWGFRKKPSSAKTT